MLSSLHISNGGSLNRLFRVVVIHINQIIKNLFFKKKLVIARLLEWYITLLYWFINVTIMKIVTEEDILSLLELSPPYITPRKKYLAVLFIFLILVHNHCLPLSCIIRYTCLILSWNIFFYS